MASAVIILRVLVASPSDVADERMALESVVDEVNRNLGQALDLRLELIKWETDVTPGIGSDPQDVINKQLRDNYDIFLGILWGRAGTETPRAVSGTIEEFDRACRRYEKAPESIEVLLYFKTAAIPVDEIDPEQITKINAFKKTAGEKGVLHKPFADLASFETNLRADLSTVLRRWKEKPPASTPKDPSADDSGEVSVAVADIAAVSDDVELAIADLESEEDYGLLDYVDISNEKFAEMGNALQTITKGMGVMTSSITRQTENLSNVNDEPNPEERLKRIKRAFKLISETLDNYSEMVRNNSSIISESREVGFDALSKYLSLAAETFDDPAALDTQEQSLLGMIDSKKTAHAALKEFTNTIESLPRFTGQFNRSKRATRESMSDLLREFDVIETTSQNLLEMISQLKATKS
jgi:hypothetical protein